MRRKCRDRFRYKKLVELRQWRDSISKHDNRGIKRRIIGDRSEIIYISWDLGITSYVHIELLDGFEMSTSNRTLNGLMWGAEFEEYVASELYRVLSRKMRKDERYKSYLLG